MGIGLALTRTEFVWLLSIVTMVFSMVPFLGAAGVYIPVAAVMLVQGRTTAAIFLLVYGAIVVSVSDNLVRAHVLHGRASLHPLVGLVSMLGGLEAIGLWGLFVGPIVAGIFYSLLRLLRSRMEQEPRDTSAPPVNGEEARQIAETGLILPGIETSRLG